MLRLFFEDCCCAVVVHIAVLQHFWLIRRCDVVVLDQVCCGLWSSGDVLGPSPGFLRYVDTDILLALVTLSVVTLSVSDLSYHVQYFCASLKSVTWETTSLRCFSTADPIIQLDHVLCCDCVVVVSIRRCYRRIHPTALCFLFIRPCWPSQGQKKVVTHTDRLYQFMLSSASIQDLAELRTCESGAFAYQSPEHLAGVWCRPSIACPG